MHLHWKKYAAECLGAGILTFAVLSSLKFSLPVSTPLIAGLTLGLFVYTVGGLSGAHINPSVTLGLWSIRKMKHDQAICYVVAQCAGALAAMAIFRSAFDLPEVTALATAPIFLVEALGAGILAFGVSAAVHEKVPAAAAGLTVGGSLTLGILLAAGAGNGVLNPAVALGIGSISWAYLLGPILGAIVAAQLYHWLAE